MSNDVVLETRDLARHFTVRRRLRGGALTVKAVDGVSLELRRGEITALVGASGSGKSTVARVLSGLDHPTGGTVLLDGGGEIHRLRGSAFRAYVRRVQMVFQDPFGSLNPVHTVGYHLGRPLRIHGFVKTKDEERTAVTELLERVQLTPADQYIDAYPAQLSGGQRQRVAIARALAARPEIVLADEPVSMLDVSIRLGLLNLLRALAVEDGIALLYITHDIASARYFADRLLVMNAGRIVEEGTAEEVTQNPQHPYTQLLLDSAPDPDRR
jgi:peptide/nickel transport system ATP-binding protein